MATPFIKGYKDDAQIQEDIKKLKDNGINESEIFIISHDVDRTERILNNESASLIKVDGNFEKAGDELRAQFKEVGFDEVEAENYEEELDKGTVFLIVKDAEKAEQTLL